MNSAEPSSWSQTPKSLSLAPRGADESNVGRTEQNRDCDGLAVGRAEGRAEGFLVGRFVRVLVSRVDGLAEGFLVGRLVGFAAVTAQSGRTSAWRKVINLIFMSKRSYYHTPYHTKKSMVIPNSMRVGKYLIIL